MSRLSFAFNKILEMHIAYVVLSIFYVQYLCQFIQVIFVLLSLVSWHQQQPQQNAVITTINNKTVPKEYVFKKTSKYLNLS